MDRAELHREGLPLKAKIRFLINIASIDAQLQNLRDSLTLTTLDVKILSINSVDLEREKRETRRSIHRLLIRREALIEAFRQDTQRAWTPYGTYSHLLSTGVFLNAN